MDMTRQTSRVNEINQVVEREQDSFSLPPVFLPLRFDKSDVKSSLQQGLLYKAAGEVWHRRDPPRLRWMIFTTSNE